MTDLQAINRFHVHQKITMMVNRYQVFADDGTGNPGALVAFVEQKRMSFKEQVTLFADQSKQAVVAAFKARKVIDLAATYDVVDGFGAVLGTFTKQFKQSLARSTWHLEQPGLGTIVVTERSIPIAIIRRLWGLLPFVSDIPFFIKFHFDWMGGDRRIASFDKVTRLRDHYVVDIEEPALDRRLAIAQAVALDALQSR